MHPMLELCTRKARIQASILELKGQKMSYHITGDINEWYEDMEYLESRLRKVEEDIRSRCCELRARIELSKSQL